MKTPSRVSDDKPLTSIGYKYISQKVLWFVATEGGVSNEAGVPCLSCYSEKIIMFLFSLGSYFNDCSTI